MRSITFLAFFMILYVFCCGCSVKEETLPGVSIPLLKMNHEIQLVPISSATGEGPNNDQMIPLQIKNLTDQPVVFPGNYGIKLYIKNDSEWKEVENKMNSPEGENILPLAKTFPPGQSTIIVPHIPNLSEKTTLRAVVVGHLENNPNQMVGAYTDLILNP